MSEAMRADIVVRSKEIAESKANQVFAESMAGKYPFDRDRLRDVLEWAISTGVALVIEAFINNSSAGPDEPKQP